MDPSKPGKHRYATSESNHGQDKTDFPKHVEDPQDSGSSFLPLLSVSAGFLQVFTRCLKKHTLSLKKITPKFLQNNMQDFLPRTFHLFLLKTRVYRKFSIAKCLRRRFQVRNTHQSSYVWSGQGFEQNRMPLKRTGMKNL